MRPMNLQQFGINSNTLCQSQYYSIQNGIYNQIKPAAVTSPLISPPLGYQSVSNNKAAKGSTVIKLISSNAPGSVTQIDLSTNLRNNIPQPNESLKLITFNPPDPNSQNQSANQRSRAHHQQELDVVKLVSSNAAGSVTQVSPVRKKSTGHNPHNIGLVKLISSNAPGSVTQVSPSKFQANNQIQNMVSSSMNQKQQSNKNEQSLRYASNQLSPIRKKLIFQNHQTEVSSFVRDQLPVFMVQQPKQQIITRKI